MNRTKMIDNMVAAGRVQAAEGERLKRAPVGEFLRAFWAGFPAAETYTPPQASIREDLEPEAVDAERERKTPRRVPVGPGTGYPLDTEEQAAEDLAESVDEHGRVVEV